jgi:ParB family chromosome partitioning protein
MAASTATDFYFEPSPVPGATLRELRPDEISTNPRQPRTVFDEDALDELAHSIKEFGVLQPIVVRRQVDGYELVMGERRLRAAVIAGLDRIPAIVRDTADDEMLRDALLENIHRAQLNPLEEAAAYQQLLQEFGATHDELAVKIGRSRSQVTNTIRLMNLPVAVQRRVAAGVLSAGHARALLGLGERDQQEELAARIVAEGLSVRATEELVAVAANIDSEGRPPSRRKPAPRFTAPALGELANNLSDTLDTRVRVDLGRRKGKITIEFGSIDDLERIVAVMAPNLATKPTAASDDDNLPQPTSQNSDYA